MEILLGSISGGFAGLLLTWLLRGWISERLKQSIQHEYAEKLETLKAQLNARDELNRLRTSLFFDHQREAFASILSQITETANKWWDTAEPEVGLVEPVPYEEYKDFQKLFFDKQLFLDSDCIFAIRLVLNAMSDSFPFDDGNGGVHHRDVREPYERVLFLRDHIGELFQNKIGISSNSVAMKEIALLGSIRLLNSYHFSGIDLTANDTLKLDRKDNAISAVFKAKNNEASLLGKLRELKAYFDMNYFYSDDKAKLEVARCLTVLGNYPIK